MVNITVNLTPALTGFKGDMWVGFLVGGEIYWYKVIAIPLSVDGVIGPFGYTDGYPNNSHQIRFPEQTINGITYLETQTPEFSTAYDRIFNITLTPKEETIVVGTSITLNLSPSTVVPQGAFTWSGKLSRDDGAGPGSQMITLLLNNAAVGSTTCDVNGYFSATSIAPSAQGSYSFISHFGGATLGLERLEASMSPEIMLR